MYLPGKISFPPPLVTFSTDGTEKIFLPLMFLLIYIYYMYLFCLFSVLMFSFFFCHDHFRLTHWKQNLFILDEDVQVECGDIIKGSFNLYRNKEWRWHLLIKINFDLQRKDETLVSSQIKCNILFNSLNDIILQYCLN